MVFAKGQTKQCKWDVTFEGPFTVVCRDTHGAYVLMDKGHEVLKRHFPVHHFKLSRRLENGNAAYDQDIFEVKNILNDCIRNGSEEYLVEWKRTVPWVDDWENSLGTPPEQPNSAEVLLNCEY